jgi:hypothetical protein
MRSLSRRTARWRSSSCVRANCQAVAAWSTKVWRNWRSRPVNRRLPRRLLILRLLRNPDEGELVAERGRRLVRDHFLLPRLLADAMRLYGLLIAANDPAHRSSVSPDKTKTAEGPTHKRHAALNLGLPKEDPRREG